MKVVIVDLLFGICSSSYNFVIVLQGCVTQKQPSKGVVIKRCSENMQQIYSRTTMPKCGFNKVTYVFSCKFAAYFQNTFS